MATFYLINTTIVGTQKMLPGQLVDDALTDATKITNAGGVLWPSADATVAAAAAKAQAAHKLRGASEADMESIMNAAVDSVQKANDATVVSAADYASVATGKGASLIGIEDAGTLFTAVNAEAALAEVKGIADGAAAVKVQSKSVTITNTEIAALGAVVTGTINLGTALPANARLLGAEINVATKVQNAGDTDTTTASVGTTASGKDEAAIKDVSLKTTGTKGSGPTSSATGYVGQSMSSEQAIVTIDSDVNLDTITAGSFTAKLFYFVLA